MEVQIGEEVERGHEKDADDVGGAEWTYLRVVEYLNDFETQNSLGIFILTYFK